MIFPAVRATEQSGPRVGHAIVQLDGLRFCAAFLVMVAHSTFDEAAIPDALLNFIWSAAAIGLSLFFVLSGFVIHYGYHETIGTRGGIPAFAIARFARLYPLYFVLLLGEIWASHAAAPMLEGAAPDRALSLLFAGTLTQAWWYGILGQNNLIFQWGNSTSAAWSISVELALYMLYPVLCIAVYRLSSLRSNLVLVASLCVAQLLLCFLLVYGEPGILQYYQMIFGRVVSDAASAATTDSADDFFQWLESFSLFLRLGEFALGVAAANIFIRHRPAVSAWLARMRITPELVAVVTLAFWAVNSFWIYPLMNSVVSYHGVMTYLGIFSFFSAALIYTVADAPRRALAGLLGSRPMATAGDLTYGTYLLHVPLLLFVHRNVANLAIAGAAPREAALRALWLLLTYAFILLVSFCVFRGLEAPARRWIRRHCTPRAIYGVIALQFALFLIGVAVVTDMQRNTYVRSGELHEPAGSAGQMLPRK